jgi:hypothetical protein
MREASAITQTVRLSEQESGTLVVLDWADNLDFVERAMVLWIFDCGRNV